jgi:hypothetical protein
MVAAAWVAGVLVARKSRPSRLVQQDLRALMPQWIDLCQSFSDCNH